MSNSSSRLDPRINAFRPDLADQALRPFVSAKHYTEPTLRQCLSGIVPLFSAPATTAHQVSELKYGEFLDIIEFRSDGYLWVQNRTDRYVGYVKDDLILSEQISPQNWRISVPHTFTYMEPDIKSPVQDTLTLGCYVSITQELEKFYKLTCGNYVFRGHVALAKDTLNPDIVYTAGRLLHTPYLWGGRTPLGIDCSGLVQLAFEMAGRDCPRDSDLQFSEFGQSLPQHWRDMAWRRGDLVFFKGHVGIMADNDHLLHANATHMQVVAEPLADMIARNNEIKGYCRF